MVVLIVESVPTSLRGELSKWMLEPKAGVFIGSISGAVRDLLWKKTCAEVREGGCTMLHSAANEQGFAIRTHGDTTRSIEQWEGLFLVRRLRREETDVFESAPLAMRLWAKADPFQPLPCHLVDVGHVAIELLQTAPFRTVADRFVDATGCPPDAVHNWVGYLTSLHDWGKGWRNFQGRRGFDDLHVPLLKAGLNLTVEETEAHIRHEAVSRVWIQEHLQHWAEWDKRSSRTVAGAIAAHHGRLGQSNPCLNPFEGQEAWENLRSEVEQMVRQAFHPISWRAKFSDHSVAGTLLAGLIVWADWIASNQELFPLRWQGEEWSEYIELSQIAAHRAIEQLGLRRENPWSQARDFAELWPMFDNPRPVQRVCNEVAKREPGLVIIEAPMGEGKSEAALFLASQWIRDGGGIYVALPTAATSNQMFGRVHEFIATHDPQAAEGVQLVHGTAWLFDRGSLLSSPEVLDEERTDGGDMAYRWFLPRKRSLLATYGVGTIDQALMSVLHVKHGFLRLFGLAGKVLVVDEVHAYDTYMNEILIRLLAWCRAIGTPIILLSATLPQQRRQELINAYSGTSWESEISSTDSTPYPLITYVTVSGTVAEIPVPESERESKIQVVRHDGMLGDLDRTTKLILREVEDGGCLCYIANTVDSAQQVYDAIRSRDPDLPVLLFHARFLAKDRRRIELIALDRFDKRSLLPLTDPNRRERPERAVLVATQVVEQSLDLDFDVMISEIAPIDLLLQRSGRLQRHMRPGRRRPPVLHVVLQEAGTYEFGSTGNVYDPYVLIRTCISLTDKWILPRDIRPLIESVYGPEPEDLSDDLRHQLALAAAKRTTRQVKESEKAGAYLIPEPYNRGFKLDTIANSLFEEDEGLQTYFTAKTRSGDSTIRVLMLEGEDLEQVAVGAKTPSRDTMQEIMYRTVNLPRWWFKDITADEGYGFHSECPRWLPADVIMTLRDGIWSGKTAKDEAFQIKVDSETGVRRIEMEGP